MPIDPNETLKPSAADIAWIDQLQPFIDATLNSDYDPREDTSREFPEAVFFNFDGHTMVGKETLAYKSLTTIQLLVLQSRYPKWNVEEHSSKEGYALKFTARRGPDWRPPAPQQPAPLPEIASQNVRTLTQRLAAQPLPRLVVYFGPDSESTVFGKHLVQTLKALGVNAVSTQNLMSMGEKKRVLYERILPTDLVIFVVSDGMVKDADAVMVHDILEEFDVIDRRSRFIPISIDHCLFTARWWLMSELRQYAAIDFKKWRESAEFTISIEKLLRDLSSMGG
ncbi:MAG TPA: hypothetical protein VE973_01550 [Candidatus Limnocylindria bacterium]|nr:hypothetical protein [Candidatus Limnocylindria bacterium]